MKIIEYEEKYLNDIRNLLTELEEYIVSIDKDNLDQVHPEYHEKMAFVDLKDINDNNVLMIINKYNIDISRKDLNKKLWSLFDFKIIIKCDIIE